MNLELTFITLYLSELTLKLIVWILEYTVLTWAVIHSQWRHLITLHLNMSYLVVPVGTIYCDAVERKVMLGVRALVSLGTHSHSLKSVALSCTCWYNTLCCRWTQGEVGRESPCVTVDTFTLLCAFAQSRQRDMWSGATHACIWW